MKHIDISDQKILCRFEKKQEPLTVGDVFELHCEWPLSVILSSPARIEFDHQETQGPYSLFVLDTISILPGKGVFKVTSYQPGNYNTGFRIISDEGVVEVKPLSWKVDSVVPQEKKETIQPFPPYGPWREVLPFWYKSLSVLTLLSVVVFIFIKIRTFIRRKKKIREVNERLKNKKPFREFISQLNLLAREISSKDGKEIITQLEKAFRLFLENQFFIFALNEEPEKIVRQLKKYYPFILKECDISGLFTEMQRLSSEQVNSEDSEQLLGMAREQAVKIYQQGEKSVK